MTETLETLVWLITLGVLYWIAWRRLLGRHLLATAPALFLALQAPLALGLILNADWSQDFHRFWTLCTISGLAIFVMGAFVANRMTAFRPATEISSYRGEQLRDDLHGAGSVFVLLLIVAISLIAGFLFTSRVGYNTFSVAFGQLQTTGTVDRSEVAALRAGATRDEYAAAGYAAQFTDVILPAVAALLWARGSIKRRSNLKLLAGSLLLIDAVFLTVVGGRKHLALVAIALGLLVIGRTSPLPVSIRKKGAGALLIVVVLLLLFGVTTLLQGRIDTPQNPIGFISDTVTSLYDRVGGDYSKAQLTLITLVRDEAPVWGRQWLEALQIALPGPTEGITFDARLHGLLYGSTRGSAPLNVWGSIYYNFGVLGIVIIPFIAGYMLQRFTIKNLVRAPRDLSRVVLLSMAGYRLALWRDPYSLLLEGGITLILFLGIHRLLKGSRIPSSSEGTPTPQRHLPSHL